MKAARTFVILSVLPIICSTLSLSKPFATNNTAKHKVQIIDSLHGYMLKDSASQLSALLNNILDEEMAVPIIQKMYSEFQFTSIFGDATKSLRKICDKLEYQIGEIFTILQETKIMLTENYLLNSSHSIVSCNFKQTKLDEFEALRVNAFNNVTEKHPITIQQVWENQKTRLKPFNSMVTQNYFLSALDVSERKSYAFEPKVPCYDLHMWSLYMSLSRKTSRKVVLLLDHGGSLSKQQFKIVRTIAKQVISILHENDYIGIITISDEISMPSIEQCYAIDDPFIANTLVRGTNNNKNLLKNFVDTIVRGNGATNHSLGFHKAFEVINNNNFLTNETVMLLYISRGLLSSLTEAKVVLETIASMSLNITANVVINTCAVIDETKGVMYETHFLRDLAEQNYSKYLINTEMNFVKGIMLSVNSSQNIGLTVARFFNTFKSDFPNDLKQLSLPIWDSNTKELIVSATMSTNEGVLGIDINFASLMEDVIYYSYFPNYSYAFIIDKNGVAVIHPSYINPISSKSVFNYTYIENLEIQNGFDKVKHMMITKPHGQYTLRTNAETIHYFWSDVYQTYTVCISVRVLTAAPNRPHKVVWHSNSANQLVHHRLDVIPTTRMCRHFNQLATLDAGSLYLSASCFQSPVTYMQSSTSVPTSSLNVQKYMAFLKDSTRYLSNPGLREEIRDDVAALGNIIEYLRNVHLESIRNKYVVRRYVTTASGVLEMFPGGFISPKFEPTKRPWYQQAIEFRFKTILTPPYLDAGGAGYIVTMAYANDYVVVAMDITFGYTYKLLLNSMPFCREQDLKCFAIDNRGYLIYHPNLIDPNGNGPIEQRHIVHKESLVASDILNHHNFVTKKVCNSYADNTIQRFYSLNINLKEVLVNAIYGEHLARYQLTAVPFSNIFIGVVNTSFEVVSTFCPCSMINRLCLNCNRMEQRECECPCECPLNIDSDIGCPGKNISKNPPCAAPTTENDFYLSGFNKMHDNELKECMPNICEKFVTYDSCLGVIGCEWCQFDVDGDTLLPNQFCTSMRTCFGGVLGAPVPYGDSVDRTLNIEDSLSNSLLPMGPVIGSVLAVCLIIIFVLICYRSYTSSFAQTERFYLSAVIPENHMRMSDLNTSDDFHAYGDNHQDKLLQKDKNQSDTSPYYVTTGYRLPLTAADSDHGYSTMTPHDESEHLSFAPFQIDSLDNDGTSDGTSINTLVLNRQRHKLVDKSKVALGNTGIEQNVSTLLAKNCIVVPVTVHRNMECA